MAERRKYKEECASQGCKPINRTKFLEGLNAGNFKEVIEMAGLCNICDEVGHEILKLWTRY